MRTNTCCLYDEWCYHESHADPSEPPEQVCHNHVVKVYLLFYRYNIMRNNVKIQRLVETTDFSQLKITHSSFYRLKMLIILLITQNEDC